MSFSETGEGWVGEYTSCVRTPVSYFGFWEGPAKHMAAIFGIGCTLCNDSSSIRLPYCELAAITLCQNWSNTSGRWRSLEEAYFFKICILHWYFFLCQPYTPSGNCISFSPHLILPCLYHLSVLWQVSCSYKDNWRFWKATSDYLDSADLLEADPQNGH